MAPCKHDTEMAGQERKWEPGGLEEGLTQTTEVEMRNDGGPPLMEA